ncbi:hypothetical protein J32TS2_28990 [Shouchella clausii]|nr:hypothetical protein J32TS2_28990 [Shouchella clausii]
MYALDMNFFDRFYKEKQFLLIYAKMRKRSPRLEACRKNVRMNEM